MLLSYQLSYQSYLWVIAQCLIYNKCSIKMCFIKWTWRIKWEFGISAPSTVIPSNFFISVDHFHLFYLLHIFRCTTLNLNTKKKHQACWQMSYRQGYISDDYCLGHQSNGSWTIFNTLRKSGYWLFFLYFIFFYISALFQVIGS